MSSIIFIRTNNEWMGVMTYIWVTRQQSIIKQGHNITTLDIKDWPREYQNFMCTHVVYDMDIYIIAIPAVRPIYPPVWMIGTSVDLF